MKLVNGIAVIDWERQETATRTEQLEEEEALSSLLSRDRDVSEIVGSSLTQNESGGSSITMWGAGGGVGARSGPSFSGSTRMR